MLSYLSLMYALMTVHPSEISFIEDFQNYTKLRSTSYIATAYHINSCGKSKSHPSYGITANGTNVRGIEDWTKRYIAVDPNLIKLGSKVFIEFPDDYAYMSGVYTAVDTGGKIKNRHIDVFFGTKHEDSMKFGVQNVKIYM